MTGAPGPGKRIAMQNSRATPRSQNERTWAMIVLDATSTGLAEHPDVRFGPKSGHSAQSSRCRLMTPYATWARSEGRTKVMGISPLGSVRLDVGCPDHLGPLLSFILDELAKVGGRTSNHHATHIDELGLHFWVCERCVDFPVKPSDDFGGHFFGRADALPTAGFEARQKFAHRWNVRQ